MLHDASLNIRQLQVFEAVARLESYSRAQQELGSGYWSVPCTLRVYGPGLDLLEVEEIQVSTALSEEELVRRQ